MICLNQNISSFLLLNMTLVAAARFERVSRITLKGGGGIRGFSTLYAATPSVTLTSAPPPNFVPDIHVSHLFIYFAFHIFHFFCISSSSALLRFSIYHAYVFVLHPYSCFLVAISHEHLCSKILLLGPYIGSSSNHPPPFSTCVSFSVGGGAVWRALL